MRRKIPDLIVLKGQSISITRRRTSCAGRGDIMRYAALVTYSDISDYGPHRMLTDAQRKIPYHLPDDALYALALYIESLQPPPNPNVPDAKSAAGKKCSNGKAAGWCHTPPYYTSGKLTLGRGLRRRRRCRESTIFCRCQSGRMRRWR